VEAEGEENEVATGEDTDEDGPQVGKAIGRLDEQEAGYQKARAKH